MDLKEQGAIKKRKIRAFQFFMAKWKYLKNGWFFTKKAKQYVLHAMNSSDVVKQIWFNTHR